jgi:hypothetical protein
MSHEKQKQQRDPLTEYVGGCLFLITLIVLVSTFVTWVTPP